MVVSGHQLFLDIPHSNNPRILRISDNSVYTDLLDVKCGYLSITPPGFNTPIVIETSTPNFNLVLTACSLGMQSHNCQEHLNVLPDGIYTIRYSVSPTDKVYVEYDHLRVTQFINRYNQKLADLEMSACEPDADVKEQLNELRLIKSFIDAAKVKVEDAHQNEDGMNLLIYAQKRLMKLDKTDC